MLGLIHADTLDRPFGLLQKEDGCDAHLAMRKLTIRAVHKLLHEAARQNSMVREWLGEVVK